MAFDASSRINKCDIEFNLRDGDLDSISFWWVTEHNSQQNELISFVFGARQLEDNSEIVYGTRAMLELLQANYANGGFTDHQGRAVEPRVGKFDNMTLTDWVAQGGLNPLESDGYTKWINKRKIQGLFQKHGEVTDRGIQLEDGIEVIPTPDATSQVELTDWILNNTGVNSSGQPTFRLFIEIPAYLNVTAQNFSSYHQVQGIVKKLNGVKQSASAALTGSESGSTWHNRLFDIPHGGGTYTIEFITSSSVTVGTSIVRFDLFGRVNPHTGYTRDHLQAYLQGTVSLDVMTERENRLGERRTPIRGNKVILTDQVELDAFLGIPKFTVQDEGSEVKERVPAGGSFRVIDHEDLSGGAGLPQVPTLREKPMVGAIHHYGTSDTILRLLRPSLAAGFSGVARPLIIDNQGTGKYQIQDWSGNNVVTLRKGEEAHLRFSFDREGQGRVLGKVSPRRQIITRGASGFLWQGGHYNYSATEWAIPVLCPAPLHNDDDAFSVPSSDSLSGETAWTLANISRGRDTFQVLKPGSLIFYQNVRWSVPGHGNMPAGLRTVFHIIRGSTILGFTINTYGAIAGDGSSHEMVWLWIGEVQAGDIIVPVLAYPKSETIGTANSPVNQMYRVAKLEQTINIEE